MRDGFGQRGLAIARRAREQHSMAGFQPIGAQQVTPLLFLDKFTCRLADISRQQHGIQCPAWLDFIQKSAVSAVKAANHLCALGPGIRHAQVFLQPVG